MNILIGIFMLYIAYRHTTIAINPNLADRAYVRWNAIMLAILTGFLGLAFLGLIGTGAA